MYSSERRVGYNVRTRHTLVYVLVRLTLHVYRGHTSHHLIGMTNIFTDITRSTKTNERKDTEGTRETQSTQDPSLFMYTTERRVSYDTRV